MLKHIFEAIKNEINKNENKKLLHELVNPYISDIKNSYFMLIVLQIITLLCTIFVIYKLHNIRILEN